MPDGQRTEKKTEINVPDFPAFFSIYAFITSELTKVLQNVIVKLVVTNC